LQELVSTNVGLADWLIITEIQKMASQCLSYLSCSPVATCFSAACSFADGHFDACICPLAKCAPLRTCSTQSQSYAVVTGGNRSIGYETARSLAQRGHRVILLCRNRELGVAAAKKIVESTCCESDSILVRIVDLGDVVSIKKFCDEFEYSDDVEEVKQTHSGYGGYDNTGKTLLTGAAVHILVNNAGLIGRDAVVVNHFGHFALSLGLLRPLLRGAKTYGGSTIVHVASTAHSMVFISSSYLAS
jgi:NAD(P)-dependent dehydrogenase (short-subunit alcohol dehydrogenase family)